ncbi:dihydrodipicolinate synthase family protein [Roseisalinus antarcticus]|uniref:L-2-keto-3-deoxyarabonate dehydratase n=1 Tax=Roseisalinus antarcticus TaxID=254357 RepID=A0A1Y5T5S7_9RHOB|nr:dihydrodipicolinate synthase family protein [Roseisalinus antarcticus]SLN56556.1 L-2-keto-3-deoxyarabonate dehydratase [Roseisalinus antarcticus]
MPLISSGSKGVFVISATPFTESGALDLASADSLTDHYVAKGADGLTILGMMGEAPKLTQAESRAFAARVIGRLPDLPVVVGVSAPGQAAIGELSKAVMDMGAAGVMVAPPGSLSTNESIEAYYAQVVETIGPDVPLVLQDFPLATNVAISNGTLGRIFEAHPSIVMLKHEDWPGLSKISALRDAEAAGRRRTSILCGNGGLFLPEEMARGADGAMTGFCFPEMMTDVVRLMTAGETERAHDVFEAYLPLVRYEQQPGVGLAVRKHVFASQGIIADARIRSPGAPLSPQAVAEVETIIRRQAARLAHLS